MLYLRWARFRRDHLPPARIWKPSGFCTLLLFHFSLLPYFPECIYRQARGEITNSQHGDEFCVHLGGVIFLFQVSVSAILLGGIAFKFRTDAEGLYGKIDVFTSQHFMFSFDYYMFQMAFSWRSASSPSIVLCFLHSFTVQNFSHSSVLLTPAWQVL